MSERIIPIDKLAPWLVSGASSIYIVVRARRLSLAKPNRAPLPDFLRDQSDVILMLLGGPMIWHLSRRFISRNARRSSVPGASSPSPFHNLRQVFTALLIGTGLLVRKLSDGKLNEGIALALRLQKITRDGVAILAGFDELRLLDLLEPPAIVYGASNGYDALAIKGRQQPD